MIVLLLMMGMVVFNRILYGSWLNPIFLQSAIWFIYAYFLFVNIGAYNTSFSKIEPLLTQQFLFFSAGGFVSFLFTKKQLYLKKSSFSEDALTTTNNNIEFLFNYVFLITFVVLALLIKQSGSFSISKIADLRESLVEDDGKKFGMYGLFQYFITIYLVLYVTTKSRFSLKYVLLFVIYFYLTLLLGAKANFLFFFCSLIYILTWLKKINLFFIVGGFIALIVIMYLVTVIRVKSSDPNLILEVLMIYTITSLPGLQLSSIKKPLVFGYFTFRIFYLWINKIGFDFPISPILSEYVATPLPTNVFSYIKPYYFDFGIWGVRAIPFFIGFVNNFIYFRARSGKISALMTMSLLIYPLIMQIFDEQYFRWLSNWVYFSIFIYLLTTVKLYDIRIRYNNL